MSASGEAGEAWTLHTADRALLGNKIGATRLGFAVLLKMFQADGRFPCSRAPERGEAGDKGATRNRERPEG